MTALTVCTLRHGPFWNFTYVVGVPGGDSLVVDPGWDAQAILSAARRNEMRISAIALTHAHHDHVNAVAALVGETGARVFLHTDELSSLGHEYPGPATGLPGGEPLPFAAFPATLLHAPGHTPGSACFVVDGAVFTGDTLMTGGAGRHGHWPGARESLAESLARLATLPPGLVVHPGHDEGPSPTAELATALAAAITGTKRPE